MWSGRTYPLQQTAVAILVCNEFTVLRAAAAAELDRWA